MLDEDLDSAIYEDDETLSEIWRIREKIQEKIKDMSAAEMGRYFQKETEKVEKELGIKFEEVSFASPGVGVAEPRLRGGSAGGAA